MEDSKRYYWIKLRTDFFENDKMDYIMSQKNGSDYVVLYQMLCLKTANTDGKLGKQLGDVLMKWDANKIQRECKYFSIDTIMVALELYKVLGLVYEGRDNIIQIAGFQDLIGSETQGAKRLREWRSKRDEKLLQCNENVTSDVTQDIRDKRLENRDKEIRDIDTRNNNIYSGELSNNSSPKFIDIPLIDKTNYTIYEDDVANWQQLYPAVDVKQEFRKMVGWCQSNPKNRKTKSGINRFINNWLSRQQDKAPTTRDTTDVVVETRPTNDIDNMSDDELLAYINRGDNL